MTKYADLTPEQRALRLARRKARRAAKKAAGISTTRTRTKKMAPAAPPAPGQLDADGLTLFICPSCGTQVRALPSATATCTKYHSKGGSKVMKREVAS